jgi:cytochrome c-type biogenesis protein CcmF
MTVLGHWLIIAALLTTAASALEYYRSTVRRAASLTRPRTLLRISTALVLVTSGILLAQFVRHDFTNSYVYSYSDRSLPLHYLISCFYAGQEGSFLFWVLCSSIIGLVLQRAAAKRGGESWVLAVYMTVQTALLLLVVAKSPFRFLWDTFPQVSPGTVVPDGRGLNPLLQNFWMVIHPPTLFLGFAAMAVPFSYALAGLWKREYDLLCAKAFPWVLFATAVLGLGIMLGGYWAYGVLGWGGYWGWDPVENSSLIPWLTGIALLHTLLAQRRTGKFLRTNFLLAVASFWFVVYSTFLTRSGILGDASVHSFTDPGATVYWMLLGLLALLLLGGLAAVMVRRKDLRPAPSSRALFTRETALGTGTLLLLLIALVVLFGTSLPIFSSIRVEPSFYNNTSLPLAILMGVLVGYSLYMPWEEEQGKETLRRSLLALAVAGGVTVLLVAMGVRDVLMAAFAFSALFAFVVNAQVALKIAKGDPLFLGGKIAHMGLAVFFLGVMGSGRYSSAERLGLPEGTPQEALGYTFTYLGQTRLPDGKFAFPISVDKEGRSYRVVPVMFEAGEQGVMRNPDIVSLAAEDIYVSPQELEQAQEPGGPVREYTVAKGGTVTVDSVRIAFSRFDMGQHAQVGQGGMAAGAVLEITKGSERETVVPVLRYGENRSIKYQDAYSNLIGAPVRLQAVEVGMNAQGSTVTIGLPGKQASAQARGILFVEASIKPFINFVWLGSLFMVAGFVLAIIKRVREA